MGTQQRVGTGTPGAMTMAMNAATGATGPKVLRIGVLQGGSVVEERVLRGRESVSVGSTERNTFTLVGEGVPMTHALFVRVGEGYCLQFIDSMQGRVAMPQGMKSLAQLRQEGHATRVGAVWQLPIDERCRGKVVVGDATLLFQFVAPPPVRVRSQLPAAIRSGLGRNIDWMYNASLAFFCAAAFSGIGYVEYLYDPMVEDDFMIDARVVTLAQPPVPVEADPPAAQPSAQQASAQPSPSAVASAAPSAARPDARAPAASPADRAQTAANAADRATIAAERAAQIAMTALARSTDVAVLTGALDLGTGRAVDRLQQGGIMQDSLAALEGTVGMARSNAANNPLQRSSLRADANSLIGVRGLGRSQRIDAPAGPIGPLADVHEATVVRGNVRLLEGGEPDGGEGRLDGAAIARGVRGALSGIRSCYERQMRTNPGLQGRLEVHFTIGASGRVTASSASGLTSAPEAGTCIAGVVHRIVFPTPVGGAVETSFSFNFAPGS